MQPRRILRSEDERNDSSEHLFPVLASEALRNASSQACATEQAKAGRSHEDKMAIFWRVCGGTVLSIGALVLITAYQSHSTALNELRAEISHGNEARAELLKKDEYAASRTKIWDKLQDMQKDLNQVEQLKGRLAAIEEQNKTTQAERNDMHELHATIKERLSQFEQQLNNGKMTQKDLQSVQQTVTALQEKALLRDQQLKQAEEERRELVKEIQALRERLAKVEARKESAGNSAKANPKTDQ